MAEAVQHPRPNERRVLVDSKVLAADELIARPENAPRGVSVTRQLAITYAGAFEFQVGRSVTWVDPSRLLFAEAGEPFIDHHVVPGVGHRSIIMTPSASALEEVGREAEEQFAARVRPCSARIQMLVQFMRRAQEPLVAEELGVEILSACMAESRPIASLDPRSVRRAKALLQDSPDGRFTLSQVAAELGLSPVHLTQSFKRSEGIPLYQYQTRLRIGRALALLPERQDITDLAFELGFSSHSHFTAAFRAELGMTPSRYRAEARSSRSAPLRSRRPG